MYQCSECGFVAQEEGSCPMCNIPMEEMDRNEQEEWMEEDDA